MFEPHAPHEAIQTWRGFFIHIATIVVGLIIAVGLEQTVEYFHHRYQRNFLEEQMREVFTDDLQLIADDVRQLKAFRGYLVSLQQSVNARVHAQSPIALPADNYSASATALRIPSLAPYEAAKDNGTIALLPNSLIRLYNRIAFQRSMLLSVSDQWLADLAAINSFKKRQDPVVDTTGFGDFQSPADLAALSPAQLIEYQALIANLINRTDYLAVRLGFMGVECQVVLDGVRDENEMIAAVVRTTKTGSGQPGPPPAKK